ncbi:hypothetical protein DN002_22435 [Salmonella enterica subsp. enterica]|nr:hypothetical protein [Salmonella enterica subsp. enterica]
MRWAIKHKSGRTLFVTSDEFIANNRRKMGWIVEKVKMTSREWFNEWFYEYTGCDPKDSRYVNMIEMYWMAWQASRAAIQIQACPFPNDHGPNVDDHYREQINNAGLKVKK